MMTLRSFLRGLCASLNSQPYVIQLSDLTGTHAEEKSSEW